MKSKRTKACDISAKVRAKVYARDSIDGAPCCIWCGTSYDLQVCHIVNRSQEGLGIEQNLLVGCKPCHGDFDNGDSDKEVRAIEHMRRKYRGWSISNLTYEKW